MGTLPTELDFVANPVASPDRMNAAMAYIIARLRALEAVTPDFVAAIDSLKQVGLDRLTAALIPVFDQATNIGDTLQALSDHWTAIDLPAQMEAQVLSDLRGGAPTEFDTLAKMATAVETYRSKYLGPHATAPTLDDNGVAVATGALFFDTALSKMRVFNGATWVDTGSIVQGILQRQAFTAAGGETSVAVTGGYDPGNIIVVKNGLTALPSDVTVTSGTNIVFAVALTAGDKVSWTKFTAITISTVYLKSEVDDLLDEVTALALAL